MNINMKYYIVTIGSIFLALGIGIIVGFNLNYDQELSKQQSEVLSQFEEKFDSLNEEKSDLNKQIDRLNEKYDKLKTYVSQNYNLLIADALTNKNTGIILTNEKNDYSEELESTIKEANGNLAFNIVIKDTIEDSEKLKEAAETTGIEIKSSQDDTTGTENGWFVAVDTTTSKLAVAMIIEDVKDRGGSSIPIPKVKSIMEEYLNR